MSKRVGEQCRIMRALHDVFNIFFFSLYSHYVGNPHEPAKETINPCRAVDNFR